MTISRRLCLCAGLSMLAGCAVSPSDETRFTGRFSLLTSAARERVTGRFALSRRGDAIRLDLLTPLSGILARIDITPESAELSRGLHEVVERERDAETLMRKHLGFAVPVERLVTWLKHPPADRFDAGPWHVSLESRFDDGAPRRIRITSADLVLTLLLDASDT